MKATDAIRKVMEAQDIGNAKLGARIGCSGAAIYERLTQENISIKNLEQMLSAMDYEVVIQPKGAGRRADGCYVIDGGGKK